MAVQPDNKIILAGIVPGNGTNYSDFGTPRYNSNGTPDYSFAKKRKNNAGFFW